MVNDTEDALNAPNRVPRAVGRPVRGRNQAKFASTILLLVELLLRIILTKRGCEDGPGYSESVNRKTAGSEK